MKNVMRWHPETGESKVYADSSEVPEGHLDCHPDAHAAKVKAGAGKPESAAKAADEKLSMTHKEITAALTEGGVAFDPKATVKDLYTKLTDAVNAALTAGGIAFDPTADTKALLELLPKPE